MGDDKNNDVNATMFQPGDEKSITWTVVGNIF